MSQIREFQTGATRNADTNKPDFEGFLSPLFIEEFGAYMHRHRHQADGSVRDSDNWQKGMPLDVYMKSLWRHFMALWLIHRGYPAVDYDTGEQVTLMDALMGIAFNTQGYTHTVLTSDTGHKLLEVVDANGNPGYYTVGPRNPG